MNIDEILSYKRPAATYYDILGCDRSSSIDQINHEYKIRALKLHPDKNPDPSSIEQFRALQMAKEILCEPSSRKSYDNWLDSRIHIPFEQWRARKTHSMHWANPRQQKLSISRNGHLDDRNSHVVNGTNQTDGPKSLLDKFRTYEI